MDKAVTADFETTTDPKDCRVWAWAVCSIAHPEDKAHGNSIQSFFRYLAKGQIETVWFHNLQFDGKFIIDYTLKCDYEWVKDHPGYMEFATLISSKGKFYQIEVNLRGHRVKFLDSLKVFPMSVKKIGETFDCGIIKGELDYSEYRPIGHELTAEELDYIERDIEIPAHALAQNFEQGLEKMTIGSNAISFYKKQFGKKRFEACFPTLSLDADADMRRAYRGGYCYVDPRFKGKEVGPGISVDYNSMYPSVMLKYPYPVGVPTAFTGEYVPDPAMPLYFQQLTCMFRLKPGAIPTLQLRGMGWYGNREYVERTIEPVQITLTSVDLAIMRRMYDIDVVSYDGGYKFRQERGLFEEYINYWGHVKETSQGGKRALAKLMLNNLYGKFATNPDVTCKFPILDGDSVRYVLAETELKDPVYLPVGAFCTAYARLELTSAIMANRERFVYCDTDSMHLLGTQDPAGIDLDDKKLMHWKNEGTFTRAKHLRTKSYVWDLNGKFSVTCAGMPDAIKHIVTWDNFDFGFTNTTYDGQIKTYIDEEGKERKATKLMPKNVPGGVVLVDAPYILHV